MINQRIIQCFLVIVLVTNCIHSQVLNDFAAKSFIDAIITDSGGFDKFVYPGELKLSKRFGISYHEVKKNFL